MQPTARVKSCCRSPCSLRINDKAETCGLAPSVRSDDNELDNVARLTRRSACLRCGLIMQSTRMSSLLRLLCHRTRPLTASRLYRCTTSGPPVKLSAIYLHTTAQVQHSVQYGFRSRHQRAECGSGTTANRSYPFQPIGLWVSSCPTSFAKGFSLQASEKCHWYKSAYQ
jgi:hypothetical protein